MIIINTNKLILEPNDLEFKKQKINNLSETIINKLEEFNRNSLSDEYCNAIKILSHDILFYNDKSKILVVPMPTGSGKSTITELSMAYMYNDEYFKQYSGTIILKLTKDDCNITANNINKYANKDIAYAYHTGIFKDNTKSNTITDEDLKTYPILVMTHQGYKQFILRESNDELEINKKRNNKKPFSDVMEWTDKRIDKLTVNYNHFIRDRLIIDEEISNVEPTTITMNTITTLENCIINLGSKNLYKDFQQFVENIKLKFIKSYSDKANQLNFVYFNDIERPQGLDEAIYDSKDGRAKEAYLDILNLIAHGGYVKYANDIMYKSITTYKYINIFNPMFKKIQLDATANVNNLYKINDNYIVQPIPDFKTYSNTYLHIYDKITGSRSSMKDNFENGLIEACKKDIENKLLENEKALIIFNNQDLQCKFYELIKDTPLLKKVWLTHYGLTTGTNKWSKYDKLFVIGINVLPDPVYPIFYFCNSIDKDFNMYDTTLTPKKGSREYKEEKFEEVRRTLVASSIIQALNRIKIRKYINGDCPETHIYLINSDKNVDDLISESMKGINILYDWDLDYSPIAKEKTPENSSVMSNAQKIIDGILFIINNPNDDFVKKLKDEKIITDKGINKKGLRELLGFSNRPVFNRALETPLFIQFCKDYNIDLSNKNNKYIYIIN